jgi:hypothetical protein
VEPLLNIHLPRDKDIDSEIGSVIVVGGENDNKINLGELEDNSNCENEPGDYPIPQSIEE